MQKSRPTGKRSPNGFGMLYIIAAMTIMGALGAGVYSFTTSSALTETISNYRDQAEFLAESGLNYAASRVSDTSFTADMLNGKTFTLGADQSFQLQVVENTTTNMWDISSVGIAGTNMHLSQHRSLASFPNVSSEEINSDDDIDNDNWVSAGDSGTSGHNDNPTVVIDKSANQFKLGMNKYEGFG